MGQTRSPRWTPKTFLARRVTPIFLTRLRRRDGRSLSTSYSCAAIKVATVARMRERFPSGNRALRLAQPKSIPFSDELYDLPDIGIGPKILLQFLDPLLQRAVFTKE